MAEYVELGDAINLLWQFADESCASVVSDFENLLPADVAQVVHGRWEWVGPYRYNEDGLIGTCSSCNNRVRFFAYPNYCPNCGAKMDLEG